MHRERRRVPPGTASRDRLQRKHPKGRPGREAEDQIVPPAGRWGPSPASELASQGELGGPESESPSQATSSLAGGQILEIKMQDT